MNIRMLMLTFYLAFISVILIIDPAASQDENNNDFISNENGVGSEMNALATKQPTAKPTVQKPNIVIYLADDLGYGEVNQQSKDFGFEKFTPAAKNNPNIISTPNLETMARQGLRLFNSYASSSLCGPSRQSLMTGLNVGRIRNRGNVFPDANIRNDQTRTLGWAMQRLGYRTGIVGKWGLGDTFGVPWRNGFDVFFGFLNERDAHRYFSYAIWEFNSSASILSSESRDQQEVVMNTIKLKENNGATVYKCRTENFTNETTRGPCRYTPDEVNKYAQEFIRSSVKSNVPFFLYWCPQTPHSGLYFPRQIRFQYYTCPVPTFGSYKGKEYDHWPAVVRGKASMITDTLDRDIGTLMNLLTELGQDKNTLVIFLSDNGADDSDKFDTVNDINFLQSNGGLTGKKRTLSDGGLKSPTIVWWPGKVPAGQIGRFPTAHYDLALTILEAANAPSSIMSIFDQYAGQPGAAISMAKEWGLVKKPQGYQTKRNDIYFEYCFFGDERQCDWVYLDVTKFPNQLLKVYTTQRKDISRSTPQSPVYVYNKPKVFDLITDPKEKNSLNDSETLAKLGSIMSLRDKARVPLCPTREELENCPDFSSAATCEMIPSSFTSSLSKPSTNLACNWCPLTSSCKPGENKQACSKDASWYNWCM